jgi:hydroxymethylpyrimidine/phosphomethylpyrimidine kinase
MQIALTIAGSDSGGGAGIQADLKTFQRYGVFGTSVVTAVTAQNTLGVRAVHPLPPDLVREQLAAVALDLRPAAVKSGMLANRALVREVAAGLLLHHLTTYILDPVMVATSGDRLLDPEAERDLLERLVPLALLVTPNLAEAKLLTGDAVDDPDGMERAGQRLLAAGARAALIKGGHLPGDVLVDVLVTPDSVRHFSHPRIASGSTHGTGCTLSAAITAEIALGRNLEEAVAGAIDYVRRAIASAPSLGGGHGPVWHGA